MAITINGGTNAITGLAAGGLPDGSVDADTLAANAVTDTKIAANAVTDAKIAANAVTTVKIAADAVDGTKIPDDAIAAEHVADDAVGVAQLSTTGTAGTGTYLRGDNSWQSAGGGTGSVLKTFYYTQAANFNYGSSSWTDVTNMVIPLTPTKTGSSFAIWLDSHVYLHETDRKANLRIQREVAGNGTWTDIGSNGPSYEIQSMDDGWRGRQGRILYDNAPTYSSGNQIKYKLQVRAVAGNISIHQDGHQATFIVQEISA